MLALVWLSWLCASAATAAPALAADLLRGIDDNRLFLPHPHAGTAALREIRGKLNADVIRADINWPSAEPRRGRYDAAYLDRVAATILAARERGLQVVVLVYRTPRWASDRTLWAHPVAGDRAGVYQSYYPPARKHLDDFKAFAAHLARKLRGSVLAYEPWCEPNMYRYLFPQRTRTNACFAAQRYAKMLRAFAAGVRSADPDALVCAGATAPFGRNDRYGTSPQRFARLLRDLGTATVFDVYTHHPYVPGGTADAAPEARPRDPRITVSLGNIDTLLRIFPDKPFYLTEFGWSTHASHTFGIHVSCVQQAAYLRRAFACMERFPQVRLGIWFPLKDTSATGGYGDDWGVYSGLRKLDGAPKRAYYAFAGGNSLTLQAPDGIQAGSPLALTGTLTSATLGPLAGKDLVVERRRAGETWKVVAHCTTGAGGVYAVHFKPARSADWRVRWLGVTGSGTNWVPCAEPRRAAALPSRRPAARRRAHPRPKPRHVV